MNKDQFKGRLAEAKDRIREVASNLMGNQEPEAKGNVQENFSARLKRRLARSSKTWRTPRSTPNFTPLF
jgi:uncharacterized protein YjbJ (UPF0337 family)